VTGHRPCLPQERDAPPGSWPACSCGCPATPIGCSRAICSVTAFPQSPPCAT
jgi:hypothetical protein